MAVKPVSVPAVGAPPAYPVRAGTTDKVQYLADVAAADARFPSYNAELNAASAAMTQVGNATYQNALSVESKAIDVEAQSSAVIALANYKGKWSSLTGAQAVGISVSHEGYTWRLDEAVADVTAEEPGVSTKWTPVVSDKYEPEVKPTLDLDFASGEYKIDDGTEKVSTTDPESVFTVARASTKWVEGPDGYLHEIPVNTVAREWRNGVQQGALIEKQRTNLYTFSEDFDNAAWPLARLNPVSTNVAISPDNTLSADKISESAVDYGLHYVRQVASVTAGQTLTTSFYAKDAGRGFAVIETTTSWFDSVSRTTYALDGSGVVTQLAGSVVDAGIVDVGNGWYRVWASHTVTKTVSSASVLLGFAQSATTTNYTGDGTSGIYIWGAQLEEGSTPSSYIPTTTAAVTRAADSVERLLGGEFNKNNFTVFADFYAGYANSTTNRYLAITSPGSNRVLFQWLSASSARLLCVASGVVLARDIPLTINTLDRLKIGISKNGKIFSLVVNGIAYNDLVHSDDFESGNFYLRVGQEVTSAIGGGKFSKIQLYPQALSVAELSALTRI